MYVKYNKFLGIVNSQISNKLKGNKKVIGLLNSDYSDLLKNIIINNSTYLQRYDLNKLQSKLFVKNSLILLNEKIIRKLNDEVDIIRQKQIHDILIKLCDSFFNNLKLNKNNDELVCNFDSVYLNYKNYIQKSNINLNLSKYFHPYS